MRKYGVGETMEVSSHGSEPRHRRKRDADHLGSTDVGDGSVYTTRYLYEQLMTGGGAPSSAKVSRHVEFVSLC